MRPVRSRAPIVTRAQWVPVGLASEVKRKHSTSPKRVIIHDTTPLALFWDAERASAAVVGDRCHHRGASLSVGRVDGGCIRCKYHDHVTKPRPSLTVVKDGIVWYDDDSFGPGTRGGPAAMHASWEFDEGQRTYSYVRHFPDCNALYMLENTLDWSHLEHIHRFSFVEGQPEVELHSDRVATYTYETSLPDTILEVENEWYDSWSTCLRFSVGPPGGELSHQFSLHFAFIPTGRSGCSVIVRVTRQCFLWTGVLGDLALMLSNELPLHEDREIVQTIIPDHCWGDDRLGAEDAFLRNFRRHWKEHYPKLVEYYACG